MRQAGWLANGAGPAAASQLGAALRHAAMGRDGLGGACHSAKHAPLPVSDARNTFIPLCPMVVPWAPHAQVAAVVGFPLMIKATAGGGGRGMRLATSQGEFLPLLKQAQQVRWRVTGDGPPQDVSQGLPQRVTSGSSSACRPCSRWCATQ